MEDETDAKAPGAANSGPMLILTEGLVVLFRGLLWLAGEVARAIVAAVVMALGAVASIFN